MEQLKITGQPASQSVNAGQTVTFKIAASGKNLKYQWQISTDGKTWTNSGIESGKTNAYTFTALDSHNGRLQRCVVTDVNGKIVICITKISTFLILCDLAVCLATLYVSFSLVFALMRYLQGKVFLIRFYSPTTLSSSRAEFRLPSRLACA